jgi:amidase
MDIRPVEFPDPTPVARDWMAHCGVETAAAHAKTYPKHKDEYGPALAGLIEVGRSLSAVDFHHILETRRIFSGEVATLFENIDLLLAPVQPWASPTIAERLSNRADPKSRVQSMRFTAPFDYTGSPALTLPGGFTETGMPIGFQLVGRHFEEDVVLRVGHGFQKATDWHKRHPKL